MDHCILCGNPDPDTGCYLTQPIKDMMQVVEPDGNILHILTDMIQERCAKGPLVYPRVMQCQDSTTHVCRLCFQQLKRRKRSCKRQLMPLDATLIQTIVPGFMRQQDSRTRERICAALTTPGNSYSHSFEVLRTLLQKDRHRRWWEYNLKTEFFSHKTIARVIRKLVP